MTESRGILAIACCWISRSGFVQWSAVFLSFADGLPSDASCRSAGEPAKRWHMTLLRQRRTACRWHPCCPYGTPSLQHLSDWLSASLDAAKAGSESPRQEPGHPFRWQQRHCCSDITVPQPGHTCPDVCERRPGGALWFLWEPLAEEGEEGATMQSRRHPGLAGRRPLHFFRKCWRVAVSAYAGAAICFFGLILRSGFRAWERRSGHLQN